MADSEHDTLVEHARAGDAEAVGSLLERHLPGLLLYVRLHAGELLRRKEESLDLCQSVCREVLQHCGGFEYRGEGAFRNWLYAQALGKIRDRQKYWHAHKRDVGREQALGETADLVGLAALAPAFFTPSQVAIREEDLQRLEQAFAALTPEHRQVITLARIVGLPHAEIAKQMGRSEVAARGLLHRAMACLGMLLSDPDERDDAAQ